MWGLAVDNPALERSLSEMNKIEKKLVSNKRSVIDFPEKSV